MGIVFVLTTQLHNQTDLWIEFDVDQGLCPLRVLPPGKTRSVKLSRILQCCRESGSPHWPIRVLINNEFSGMYIHPRDHLLFMTRIVFKYKRNTAGFYVLSAEGVKEKGVDYVLRLKVIGGIFGRNRRWDNRPLIEIAQAESTWSRNLREFEDPNLVAPSQRHDSSLPLRQGAPSAGRGRSAATSPPQQERIRRRRNVVGAAAAGRTTTSESVLNSGENSTAAAVERDQKRLYRFLALQKRDTSTHVLLFGLAFIMVAFARLFYK